MASPIDFLNALEESTDTYHLPLEEGLIADQVTKLLKGITDADEDGGWLVGLVPVVGTVYDCGIAISFLGQIPNAPKEEHPTLYLQAALSFVSAVPAIGDLIGKGGKILLKYSKTRKLGQKAVVASDKIADLQRVVGDNKAQIEKILKRLDHPLAKKAFKRMGLEDVSGQMMSAIEGLLNMDPDTLRGETDPKQVTAKKKLRGKPVVVSQEYNFLGKRTMENWVCDNCGHDHGKTKLDVIKVKSFDTPILAKVCDSCAHYNVFDTPEEGATLLHKGHPPAAAKKGKVIGTRTAPDDDWGPAQGHGVPAW